MSEQHIKNIKNYTINLDQELGSGAFGTVYRAHRKTDQMKCAIKMIRKDKINGNDYLMESLMQEIEILQTLHSPNIVAMLDVFESKNNYYIIQELCDSDLDTFILKHKKISEETAISILSEITTGFTQLVKEGIIHRDLKPANILMKDGQVKIGDFGFAKNNICQKMKVTSCIGSPLYKSPQVLKGEHYSSKCDVWGLGFIFYQLLHKKTPWTGESEIGLLKNIEKNQLLIDQKLTPNTIDFLKKTLEYEEADRLSWDQVFSHPIFSGMFEYLRQGQMQIEDKLKMLMTALRQEISRKNIDVHLLLKTLQFQDNLTFPQFTRFIQTLCSGFSSQEIRYIFDKLDEDSSGTVEVAEIQNEMMKNSIKIGKDKPIIERAYTMLEEQETPQQMLLRKVMRQIHKAISQAGISLSKYFEAISNNPESMNFQTFKQMMLWLEIDNCQNLQAVFKEIDRDNSNTIEYDELKLAFCHVNRVPIEALEKQNL